VCVHTLRTLCVYASGLLRVRAPPSDRKLAVKSPPCVQVSEIGLLSTINCFSLLITVSYFHNFRGVKVSLGKARALSRCDGKLTVVRDWLVLRMMRVGEVSEIRLLSINNFFSLLITVSYFFTIFRVYNKMGLLSIINSFSLLITVSQFFTIFRVKNSK